jgi:hypothetical protein
MNGNVVVRRARVLTGLAMGALCAAPVSGCFGSNTPDEPKDAGADIDVPGPDGSGGCPAGWYVGSGGACFISLMGSWTPSTDSNTNGPDTVATLGQDSPQSVSVVQSHTGMPGADCGCNAQHLQIPLGRTFSCKSATLEFVYSTTTTFTGTNAPALDIRFCTGPCPTVDGGGGPQFYTGPQYVASPLTSPGPSSCGYEWENDAGTASLNAFPQSALIASGATTTVPLGNYVAPSTGDDCTGSFDTIDVHMQVYNCFPTETGTDTLASLRIY